MRLIQCDFTKEEDKKKIAKKLSEDWFVGYANLERMMKNEG